MTRMKPKYVGERAKGMFVPAETAGLYAASLFATGKQKNIDPS
ncbi:hypothetical protein BRAO375_3440022 [Bradyrhizobium sp. ORS 375]|nr:hypothetical protein BRAO375_3440022 [Bradyrhizobium sp. ORS 375]